MILRTDLITPRITYMAQWLGEYLFGEPMQVTLEDFLIGDEELFIAYTDQPPANERAYHIAPQGLLFETVVRQQTIDTGMMQMRTGDDPLPFFFGTSGEHPFDVLAASFYLLQRYEEYLPHEKDLYGRYPHNSSIAFQHGFLQLPLVDLWMMDLKERLKQRSPELRFRSQAFRFQPTFDVDIAFKHLGKGSIRNAAFILRNIHRAAAVREVLQVLQGKRKDPFDVYGRLQQLHQRHGAAPIFFFLIAARQHGLDKNIDPRSHHLRSLIATTARQSAIGIHLSAAAAQDPQRMAQEQQLLQELTAQPVTANRMHYLLFDLPEGYRRLISLGITHEYSMGYGSINGFRASTCRPYAWYDLQQEQSTGLTVHPFCYMEANSIFEQKDTPEQALQQLEHYHQVVQQVGGELITIFHPHLMGDDAEGSPWMDVYEQCLRMMMS